MMRVHYVRRQMVHKCDAWGMQLSPVQTNLLRATSFGSILPGKLPLKVSWEWVCTGKAITGGELEYLLSRYPICNILQDDDLHWRSLRKRGRG